MMTSITKEQFDHDLDGIEIDVDALIDIICLNKDEGIKAPLKFLLTTVLQDLHRISYMLERISEDIYDIEQKQ